VGRVVEVGEGVAIPVGTTVFVSGGGTWTQQVTAPAAGFVPLPPGDLDQLAMLVSSPATAHLLLDSHAHLNEGDWVLQSAANSAVGSAVVQLAKARGLRTVILVRREEVVADLEKLGADVVLVGTDDLVARIEEATGGASIALSLDAIGGPVLKLLVDALDMGGTLVSYSQVLGQLVSLVAGGQLTLAVDSTYTLDQIAEAATRSMAGRRTGKVMLHPNG
jgi:NADPH:quinone reductase-like Zn-dependent oxidoreductase